jgi:tetratricopeptide (TPR) repeat protein
MTPSSKNADPLMGNPDVLATWKGIAAYFGCNVRTVRRYEQERGLPVHRAPGKRGSTVYARASELTAWLESRGKEQRLDPVPMTSGTAGHRGNVAQNNSLSAEATLPSATSSDEHQAKQVSFLRWRPWVIAACALLVSSAVLFWKVGNHQKAAATTISQLDALKARPHVPAPVAEDLFLRGRYYWNLRTADGLAKAIDSFTQAIVTDPSYADAYAGLAESYDLLPQFGRTDLGDSLRKAEHAADRAIELNPNLAAAHTAKAFALFYLDWDIAGSDAEFRKALALDPNSAQTHHWYASTLLNRLEGAECMRQIDEALRLSPESAAIATDSALIHEEFGDNPGADVKRLQELEQSQPNLLTPGIFLKQIDFAKGDYPAYITELRHIASITRDPDDIAMADNVGRGWARNGRIGMLQAMIEVQKKAFRNGTETGFLLGQTYLLLGHPEEALPYFKASLDRHFILLITMQDCDWGKKLSTNPNYAALFSEIHERMHGGPTAHPALVPASFRLPQ